MSTLLRRLDSLQIPDLSVKKWVLFFAACAFVHGLLYVAIIPPWQTPDEPRHYEYVRLLHDKGRLVEWGDITPAVEREVIESMDQFSFWKWGASEFHFRQPQPLPTTFAQVWGEGSHELFQPPLAYMLYLLPQSVLATQDLAIQLYAMRIVSVLLNVLIVLAAFVTGRELFPEDLPLALAIPFFVLLLPAHTFLTAGVNNDHLAELAIAWSFPVWIRAFRYGLSPRRIGALGLALLIGLASKRSALVDVPILVAGFIFYALRRVRSQSWNWRMWVKIIAIVGMVFALASVSALAIWPLLSTRFPKFTDWFLTIFLFLPSQQFPFTLDARVASPEAVHLYLRYVKTLFISTWGHYGWMDIQLGVRSYWLIAGICALSLLGLIHWGYALVRGRITCADWQRTAFALFLLSIAAAFVLVIGNEVRRWDLAWGGYPQGRYLFPVLIPMSTFYVIGLREFVPRSLHRAAFWGFAASMILFDLIALFGFIIPFYYAS